jgi:1,2-diacylglycerol 3-beta-glucosyltransferase
MRRLTGRILSGSLDAAVHLAATASVALSGYLAVVSIVGLRRPPAMPPRAPSTRFAILVPAHDEAAGIGETLASLDRLDYPSDLFEVHVVADNCSDDTAGIVRNSGWQAHERDDVCDPGKGPALNWLFDRLADQGALFDAIAIVDADTTVDPGFLLAMDRALAAGAEVAQGFYSVREPDASPATTFRYAALACRHHLRGLGRCRLGASCGLYGNGMVFRRPVLATHRWSGHLIEDAELQNELLLDGVLVTYAHDAVVEAEMPVSNEAARSQNQRWERGRIELAQRYVPRLTTRALRRRSHRIAYVDAVFDHLVPPLSVLLAFELAAAGVAAGGVVLRRRGAGLALSSDVLAILAVAGHVVGGLLSVGAPRQHFRALAGAPRIAAWKVGLWIGVAADGDVAWTRTRRNSEDST